jgi:hypothetical protein
MKEAVEKAGQTKDTAKEALKGPAGKVVFLLDPTPSTFSSLCNS